MKPPPFHRRIIPLIFILVFLVIAPLLVFYTAGYRWNTNKGKVERNGTVIIDSFPTGADIDIDNRITTYKTPVTIQNMPPGLHNFRIYKQGYHEWLKNLEVRPELVTFMNNIWLWKNSTPIFVSPGNFESLSVSPDSRYLFKVEITSSTNGLITNLLTDKTQKILIENTTGTEYSISWSPNSDYVLLKQKDVPDEESWLIDIKNASSLGRLPTSDYRFTADSLIGITNNSLLTINLRDASINRAAMAHGIIDASETADLKSVTSTSSLIFIAKSKPDQGFILPNGKWKFWEFDKNYVLLNDGQNWLSLVGRNNPEEYHLAQAKDLQPFKDNTGTSYLLINNSEIWTWRPTEEPSLIYRQTDKITDAAWHAQGGDIFFATDKKIFVINLDTRDGYRISELADFDKIDSFAYYKGVLQIAASRGIESGIWSLAVE
ncbi:MAG: PEGA domain-containing protein [Patescibacteria group bacterium]